MWEKFTSLPRDSLFSVFDLTQRKSDFESGMCDRRLLIEKISCEIQYNHPAECLALTSLTSFLLIIDEWKVGSGP